MKMQELWVVLVIGVVGIWYFTGFVTAATQVRTECVGNRGNCGPANGFNFQSTSGEPIEWLGVSWDGDKVRGIRFRYFNNPVPISVGDVYPGRYASAWITFLADETLTSLTFKDSGYGYNSLRRLELSTSRQRVFGAGPGGYDTAVVASGVIGTRLSGFYGLVNPDNFMQSLGASILLPYAAPATGLALNTEFIGNNFRRWSGGFAHQYINYPVQWLGVRWDGDKVRGLSFRLFSGQTFIEGDFSKQYGYSEICFSPGENLASLTLKDSGYGHGSLRRIEMTTTGGQTFIAGPDGFDSVTSPAVTGATLVGFFGLVNVDKFMQSLGATVIYPECSGMRIVPDDESGSTSAPVTDLTGLAGPEKLCSTTQITCNAPSGNRRLLLGIRRRLIDDVTRLAHSSAQYRYFTDTVALYDLDVSDNASNSGSVLFRNPSTPPTLAWHIDRQTSTVIDGIRYNVLAVQGGPNGQRGETFASVLVPTVYNIGQRRIRNAFIESQAQGRTLLLGPEGGYAPNWNFVHSAVLAPPQGNPPSGYIDDSLNRYTRSLIWLLLTRTFDRVQGCRP